jgi:hypothetical protein
VMIEGPVRIMKGLWNIAVRILDRDGVRPIHAADTGTQSTKLADQESSPNRSLCPTGIGRGGCAQVQYLNLGAAVAGKCRDEPWSGTPHGISGLPLPFGRRHLSISRREALA